MRETPNNGGGLLDPVWNILDQTLAAAQNRLELFRVEAQEEKIRLVEIVLLASAIMVLGTLALALATFLTVLLAWRSGSMIALAALTIAYIAGACVAGRLLRARLQSPPPFAATAEEFRKDRECLPR
jgi:uncharacterized membrane protein YqjE